MKEKENWNNLIPAWLNIFLVSLIFATLIYGAIIFLQSGDQISGIRDYQVFIPSGFCIGFYFVTLFIVNLFASAGLADIIMITLLIAGLIILSIGFISKTESNKSTAFGLASAVLGLALGIPFGDKLRQPSSNPRNNHKPRMNNKSKIKE